MIIMIVVVGGAFTAYAVVRKCYYKVNIFDDRPIGSYSYKP